MRRVTFMIEGTNAKCAAYKITNVLTGASYVGVTSRSFRERATEHLSAFYRGTDNVLYRAMRKYGVENFSMSVVAQCRNAEDLFACEIELVAQEKTHVRFGGYNMTDGGEATLGWLPSSETRAKIREASRAQMRDPIVRAHLSECSKRQWLDPDSRKRCQEAMRGKTISAEHRRKIGDSARGRPKSEATRAKLRAALIGKPRSEELKARLSQLAMGRKCSPEARAKMSASHRGVPKPESWKESRRKVHAQEFAEIRRRLLSGESADAIAIELGVHAATLSIIARRVGLRCVRAGLPRGRPRWLEEARV